MLVLVESRYDTYPYAPVIRIRIERINTFTRECINYDLFDWTRGFTSTQSRPAIGIIWTRRNGTVLQSDYITALIRPPCNSGRRAAVDQERCRTDQEVRRRIDTFRRTIEAFPWKGARVGVFRRNIAVHVYSGRRDGLQGSTCALLLRIGSAEWESVAKV